MTVFDTPDVHSYQPGSRHRSSNGNSRHHHHHAGHGSHHHKMATPFQSPMLNYSMMDLFMPTNGFSSFASFNGVSSNGGRSGAVGAIKRTSTSTTFANGKKLMTKR